MPRDFGRTRAGLGCASVVQASMKPAGRAHRVGARVPPRRDHPGDAHRILEVQAEDAGSRRVHVACPDAMRLVGTRREPRPVPDGGRRRVTRPQTAARGGLSRPRSQARCARAVSRP